MIIIHIDLSFILFQKYYTFDVTIKESLNKTIAYENGGSFPMTGSIIIGAHILKYYLLLACYLISLFKLEFNKFINNDTNNIFILLKLQLCCVLATLFILINKKGVENDDVMDAFIFTIAKISIFIICDCFILIVLWILNIKSESVEHVDSKKEVFIFNKNNNSNKNIK